MTRTRAALAVTTALLLAGSLAAPATAAQERRAPAVAITGSNTAFSPNGDGSKDVGVVTYRLAEPGVVTVTIRRDGEAVVTKQLGRQSKGTKTFRWNGKRAGKVVTDGTYVVTVASRGGRARTPLEVDARYAPAPVGRLDLSSGVVYPRTTVIDDVVTGSYQTWWWPTPQAFPLRYRVSDAAGRVVRTGPVSKVDSLGSSSCHSGCGRLSWDGRDDDGAMVAPGDYRLRLAGPRSAAGNPQVFGDVETVRVSSERLVASTSTSTSTARGATYRDPFAGSMANGLYDYFCPGSSAYSTRFPDGGISYSSHNRSRFLGPEGYCVNVVGWTGPVPARATPYDDYSLTAVGGPTTAGDTDRGVLSAAWGQPVTMTGDLTATVAGRRPAGAEVPDEDGFPDLLWRFEIDRGQSYDLASFTYTLTQYVPGG